MSTVIDLRGRHLLTLDDFSPEEIIYLLDLAAELKAAKREGREEQKLIGKEIALIFEKDSTRTRCAFEVAAYDQGAHVTFIGPGGSHMGHKETVKDTARVLGRMYDAIEYRGFGQDTAEELAQWAGVPVYNGLTDEWHPTQILADFLTFREHIAKPLDEVAFCYLGDARFNMADSLPDRRREARHGRARSRARRSLWPQRGDRRARALDRGREQRREDHDHRGRRGGGAAAPTCCSPTCGSRWASRDEVWKERIELLTALPGERRDDGADRQPGREVHALPAGVPQHRHRRSARRSSRSTGWMRSRSPRRSSSRRRRSCSTRPRTECTRSRPSWSRRWEADDARRRRARRQRAAPARRADDRREPAGERRAAPARRSRPIALEHELVISHGNGPQVGLLALQGAAYTEVATYPLDVLDAQTQGMIGYLIMQELGNVLPSTSRSRRS